MSSISNITGSTVSQTPATGRSARKVTGGDADGDNDGTSGAGRSGRAGKSNFMNAILQALGQSLPASSATTKVNAAPAASNSSSTPNATQDQQSALHAFVQNLMSALHQAAGSSPAAENNQANSNTTTANSTTTYSPPSSGGSRNSSNLVNGIQNLLQQLSATGQTNTTGSNATLDKLNASYQTLANALNASSQSPAPGGATSANLKSFLNNLLQDLNGGQSISGAVVNTTA